MNNILNELAELAKQRVADLKEEIDIEDIRYRAESLRRNTGFQFEKALKTDDIAFICEVKKASPSKGVISEDFPFLEIAKDYEKAGAAAISVLTEPFKFLGSGKYLRKIAAEVKIPTLRKDFIVDEYMIYEAKILGASAVLLICSILTDDQLADYIELAHDLGMSALVEAHDEKEVKTAVDIGAGIIGVNNRDLGDLSVNMDNSARLRDLVPPDRIFVSESGIKTAEDVEKLRKIGANAVLIGETLMTAPDRTAKLAELRGK